MELLSCNEHSSKFPLESLLRIYCKKQLGQNNLVDNDFQNFKLLLDWLGPIELPEYPVIKLYWFELRWDIIRIAEICKTDKSIIVQTLRKIYYGHVDG